MVGRLVSFWVPAYFQVRTVSFREGKLQELKMGHQLGACKQPYGTGGPVDEAKYRVPWRFFDG